MVITQSQLTLTGGYALSWSQQTHTMPAPLASPLQTDATVELSSHATTLQQINASSAESVLAPEKLAIWLIIKALIKKITGRDVDLNLADPTTSLGAGQPGASVLKEQATRPTVVPMQTATVTSLSQSFNFSVSGEITTSNGQTINLNDQLSLFQQISTVQTTTGQGGVEQDPLVINFGSNSANLTGGSFQFDLLGNGQKKNMPFVGPGSGFLVLDKNNNGKIDDGTELFGPASGNGFADLAKYDADGNGWIDANDPVWSQLKVWTKDSTGKDQLLGLDQLGIGAIGLQSAETQRNLNDNKGAEVGKLSQTGIFLYDNGKIGTVQDVDIST